VRAQVAVHAGAFDAHEYAEVQTGPVRARRIAVGALPVAGHPRPDVLHVFGPATGRAEFPARRHFVDLVALMARGGKKKQNARLKIHRVVAPKTPDSEPPTCNELRICCSMAATHSSRSSELFASNCHCLLSNETIRNSYPSVSKANGTRLI